MLEGLQSGALFVTCPCCDRAIHNRELRHFVQAKYYSRFVTALREQAGGMTREKIQAIISNAAKNVDLQTPEEKSDDRCGLFFCPRCLDIGMKVGGCSTVDCYNCGPSIRPTTLDYATL